MNEFFILVLAMVDVGDRSSSGKYGEAHKYDENFKGPIQKRSCTDIFCFFLFVAFVVGWGAVGVVSFTWGNPMKLVYPSNSKGEICGRGDHWDKPYLLFFDLTKCLRPSAALSGCPTPEVCVKECPNEVTSFYGQGKVPSFNQTELKLKMSPFCSPMVS